MIPIGTSFCWIERRCSKTQQLITIAMEIPRITAVTLSAVVAMAWFVVMDVPKKGRSATNVGEDSQGIYRLARSAASASVSVARAHICPGSKRKMRSQEFRSARSRSESYVPLYSNLEAVYILA
jgi:hypothetical protein